MTIVRELATVTHFDDSEAETFEYDVFPAGSLASSGCEFETKVFDFADFNEQIDPEGLKTIKAVALEIQDTLKPARMSISIGQKENVNDPITWFGPFQIEAGKPKHLRLPKCRYAALRVVDPSPLTNYEISRIVIYGTAMRRGSRK